MSQRKQAVTTQRFLHHRGFTLIELLVVISIIALLISILLPALTKSRYVARSTICLANCRSITTAMAAYEADEGRYPLHFQEAHWNYAQNGAIGTKQFWANRLSTNGYPQSDIRGLYQHYYSSTNFFNCPHVAFIDRSITAVPLGERRVYGSYFLAPGYWKDRDLLTGTDWSNLDNLWTRPQDIWMYEGYKVNAVAGDMMFWSVNNNYGTRMNHPGAIKGAVEYIHPGTAGSWCDSYFQTNDSQDHRDRTDGNYAFKDGSARNIPGNDESLHRFYTSGESGATDYLVPVER